MCCDLGKDLDYLPRGVARRAPELQDVPKELVGEAKNGGDDRVGIARAAEAQKLEERAPLQAPAGGAFFQDGRGARPLTSESMLFVQSVSKKFVRKASSTLAAVRH